MPTVLTVNGFKLFFWASDGDEPVHVHAGKKPRANSTKFTARADGTFELTYHGRDMSENDVRRVHKFINNNYDEILRKWKSSFPDKEIKLKQ